MEIRTWGSFICTPTFPRPLGSWHVAQQQGVPCPASHVPGTCRSHRWQRKPGSSCSSRARGRNWLQGRYCWMLSRFVLLPQNQPNDRLFWVWKDWFFDYSLCWEFRWFLIPCRQPTWRLVICKWIASPSPPWEHSWKKNDRKLEKN